MGRVNRTASLRRASSKKRRSRELSRTAAVRKRGTRSRRGRIRHSGAKVYGKTGRYSKTVRSRRRRQSRAAIYAASDWRKQTAAILALPESTALLAPWVQVLNELGVTEVILVTGPLDDSSLRLVREHLPGAALLHFAEESRVTPQALAMGAEIARAPILLMLAGDPVEASRLAPFAQIIATGAHIAINDPTPGGALFVERDPASIVREFVNVSTGQQQLGSGCLSVYPYAISRQAAANLGFARLAEPGLALSLALEQQMRVKVAGHLPPPIPLSPVILSSELADPAAEGEASRGFTLQGLHHAMEKRGERLGFPDTLRNRKAAEGEA